jgi:hypothetical protein
MTLAVAADCPGPSWCELPSNALRNTPNNIVRVWLRTLGRDAGEAQSGDGRRLPFSDVCQPSLAGGNRLQHYAMQITNRQLCALSADTRATDEISAGYEVMFV